MYKSILKPLFFLVPPERAHYMAMGLLKLLCILPGAQSALKKMFLVKDKALERQLFGLSFPNPVGLAAGFDKDARWVKELECLGFGFIEIGTVTPLPQPGNDKPRLFRLPQDEALINRMGFNNSGARAAANKLRRRHPGVVIGGNIGKNKITPNENALSDYVACFQDLYEVVDYFVVNVSSPNTPGLRSLQEKEPLMKILTALEDLNRSKPKRRPLLLKIAPDLSDEQLNDIIDIVRQSRIDGVVATNTTISRDSLKTSKEEVDQAGTGGLSGKPMAKRSTEVIRYLKEKSGNAFPVIGVGGIHTAADAQEKLDVGADLIQVYTGFIYEGPSIARRINSALAKRRSKH
jgi:dihydroorotate dehydrogenase